MSDGKRLFVTVGTTKFEKLIDTVSEDSMLDKLAGMGYTEIQFQHGNGAHETKTHTTIALKYNRFFENFIEEIAESDLVISHAGSGTCLDVLKLGKPLIVVVNDDLMDNHQLELAEQLQHDEYVYFCTCADLWDTLDKNLMALRKYPRPNRAIFGNYLNKCMGFV